MDLIEKEAIEKNIQESLGKEYSKEEIFSIAEYDESKSNELVLENDITPSKDTINDQFTKVNDRIDSVKDENKTMHNIVVGSLFVLGLAVVGWFYDGVYRYLNETLELRKDVIELRIENKELKNNISDIKKDYEIMVKDKYNDFLQIQLNKKQ